MDHAQTSTARGDNVINKVVNRIAEIEDVDPLELTPPIYKAIDPEILYQILSTETTASRMEGQVTFFYHGYEVRVGDDGSVSVGALEE